MYNPLFQLAYQTNPFQPSWCCSAFRPVVGYPPQAITRERRAHFVTESMQSHTTEGVMGANMPEYDSVTRNEKGDGRR